MIKQIGNRWRVDVWVRLHGREAKRVREWVQIPGERAAALREQQIIADVQAGVYDQVESKDESPTVAGYEEDFLRFVKVNHKASTLKTYRDSMRNHVVPQLGTLRLDEVGHAQVEQLKDHVLDLGLSKKTANNQVGVLSALLELALKQRQIHEKPHIDWLAIIRKKEPALTREEYVRLEMAAEPEWRTMMRAAVLSGLRIGELCQLRWAHVDLQAGWIYVREAVYRGKVDSPKHGRERDVPIVDELLPLLKAQRRPGVDFVFATKKGGRHQPYNAPAEAMARASRKSGLGRDCGWHLLRHTWATWNALDGMEANTLMLVGGWGSLSMVQQYVNLSGVDVKKAMSRLATGRVSNEEQG